MLIVNRKMNRFFCFKCSKSDAFIAYWRYKSSRQCQSPKEKETKEIGAWVLEVDKQREKINRYLLKQKSKLIPEHAQHIYKKAHTSAIDQYQNPEKRRGGKRQSPEEVAHKAAWAAVKKQYKKKGNEWVKKED